MKQRSIIVCIPVSYTHLDVYKRQDLHHLILAESDPPALREQSSPEAPGQSLPPMESLPPRRTERFSRILLNKRREIKSPRCV